MTQEQRVKKEKAGKAEAEALIEKTVAEIKGVTADQIEEQIDRLGVSWRQAGVNLGIGSPGATRAAYRKLTGRHHSERKPLHNRAPKGTGGTAMRARYDPKWDDESDQEEIEAKLKGAHILVERTLVLMKPRYEELRVRRVTSFTFGRKGDQPLQVWVVDDYNGASRCFRVADIKEVR